MSDLTSILRYATLICSCNYLCSFASVNRYATSCLPGIPSDNSICISSRSFGGLAFAGVYLCSDVNHIGDIFDDLSKEGIYIYPGLSLPKNYQPNLDYLLLKKFLQDKDYLEAKFNLQELAEKAAEGALIELIQGLDRSVYTFHIK